MNASGSLLHARAPAPDDCESDAADNYYWTFSRSVAAFNPLRYWKRVDVPVLLIYGQRDERVPVEPSIAGIRNALRLAGKRACRLRVFSSADHSMRIASRAGESFRWPQNADGYLDTIVNWIAAVANRPALSSGTTTC
ncbi:MAG TPA: prolyl oligopeptidase family serine peptidase [Gemmatimonadaceae bacterium]|nr:prolyl oligopeptidase family serine peptidase [Gemmatimonadaceae bacterium]